MGEIHFEAARALMARPLPYRGGTLDVLFATAGMPGGGMCEAELVLFDLQGRRIRTLSTGVFSPGMQEASWYGLDEQGGEVPSGVYFLRLAYRGQTEGTLRVVVVGS